ncbi:forkhead box protein P2-like isoform X1 [Alosa sapidissima]|uniref:forkhead box protein P2-like isoform X1 n=1 Tax=Alosa sapidissima TaxID=34773 RepID=UPI001C0A335B|nr:forkhead box protein P2-like isoform X1 [Alosa sapidissima]
MMGSQMINQQLHILAQQKRALILQQQQIQSYYKRHQEHIKSKLQQQQQSDGKDKMDSEKTSLIKQVQRQEDLLKLQQAGLLSHTLPFGLHVLECQRIWMEQTSGHSDVKSLMSASTDLPPTALTTPSVAVRKTQRVDRSLDPDMHSLYGHGICRWPACELECEDFENFLKHLDSEHVLDDKSTAQCRVQMQVVEQLALQLSKEQERLQAMMSHLHTHPSEPHTISSSLREWRESSPLYSAKQVNVDSEVDTAAVARSASSPREAPPHSKSSPSGPPSPRSPARDSSLRTIRHQHYMRPHVPLCSDLSPDYECYRNADVRPPFTYAALIRQAIIEASDMRLTLNEIYHWFTRTFAFFRRNAATWKNAVRHNLSLHKCFVRVENVKGAVWTVDEMEYQKRKAQKITSLGNRGALHSKGQRPAADRTSLLTENSTPLNKCLSGLKNPNSKCVDGTGPPESFRTQEHTAFLSDIKQLTGLVKKADPTQEGRCCSVLFTEGGQASPEPLMNTDKFD